MESQIHGSLLFDCGGKYDRKFYIVISQPIIRGGMISNTFLCLPVSFAKYAVVCGDISRHLLHNSAFKHYPFVHVRILSCHLRGESFSTVLDILLLLLLLRRTWPYSIWFICAL